MATAAATAAAGLEAASWRRLADDMRRRADLARPGSGKALLVSMANLFDDAFARALDAEQASALPSE